MGRMQKVALAAAVAFAPIAASAAPVVTVVSNAPASWSAVDLTNTTTIAGAVSFDASIVNGSVASAYKSPFDPALANNGSDVTGADVIANWQDLDYFTVGSPALKSSPATLTLDGTKSIFSILWGSIDTYNAIQFWRDGALVDTVDGNDVFAAGGLPAASGAAFVKITGLAFDEVRFFSNYPGGGTDTPAFEFSNVVAAVPLPAGGLLLLGALGGLAVLRRRGTAA